jgi:ribonuclease T2
MEDTALKLRGFLTGLALSALAVAGALPAHAQRQTLGQTPAQAQGQALASRNQPGDFDYYALVLSWSPSYCAGEGASRRDPQCSPNRPYAFVLHGLWPQYTRGFPENCRTAANPFVPNNVINGIIDIMPSRGLIIHEYKKHGTCAGLEPQAYFDTARKMFNKIKVPGIYQSLDKPLITNAGDITKAFLAANPTLKPEMMGIACGRPNRMKEIRFCFSKEGEFKTCGTNEKQDRLCRSPSIYLPPVRAASARGGLFGRQPAAPAPTLAPLGERRI